MNLSCSHCGAPFAADDVHADLGIDNCRSCRGVIDLRARAQAIPLPRPQRFTVERAGSRLEIHWRWFQPQHLGLVLFAVAWNSFLYFWYHGAFHGKSHDLVMILFPLGHVAVGIGVAYSSVAHLLNSTSIVCDGNTLTIAYRPLPWRGSRTLEAAAIRQLFTRKVEGSKGSISYVLSAAMSDGTQLDLVRGTSDPAELRFLEQELEQKLGIVDQAVVGELARA